MKVKQLAAWPVTGQPQPRPLCQHDVQMIGDWARSCRQDFHDKKLRRYKHTDRPSQCTFLAVVEIDGVPLCRRHAGQIALDHLLASQKD